MMDIIIIMLIAAGLALVGLLILRRSSNMEWGMHIMMWVGLFLVVAAVIMAVVVGRVW